MDYAVVIVIIIAGITLIQRMVFTTKNIKDWSTTFGMLWQKVVMLWGNTLSRNKIIS
jgi:hypothetical protein